jgi:hypothetical protein
MKRSAALLHHRVVSWPKRIESLPIVRQAVRTIAQNSFSSLILDDFAKVRLQNTCSLYTEELRLSNGDGVADQLAKVMTDGIQLGAFFVGLILRTTNFANSPVPFWQSDALKNLRPSRLSSFS